MAKKKTDEPAPQVPTALRERYATMLEVIQGRITVSEGARRLGMSRNHFQTLMHRALGSLLAGITPREPGRPGKPVREAELERENDRLRRELERLRGRNAMIDRLLGVASGVIRGRVRASRTRKASGEGGSSEGDDSDPGMEIVMRVEAERELRKAGLPVALSCAVVGASPATVRRWRRRSLGPAAPRGDAARLGPELRAAVEALVRALKGLIGADAIRRAVPGVSRRQAAAVKHATLAAMERERKAGLDRVVVTTPGIVRGFDAMQVAAEEGDRYALIAGDAACPTAPLPPRSNATTDGAWPRSSNGTSPSTERRSSSARTARGATRSPRCSTSCASTASCSCRGRRAIPATTVSSSGRTGNTVPGSRWRAASRPPTSIACARRCSWR